MATRGVHCGISHDNIILYTALEIEYDGIGLFRVDVVTINITHFLYKQQSTEMGGNERDSYELTDAYVHHCESDTI